MGMEKFLPFRKQTLTHESKIGTFEVLLPDKISKSDIGDDDRVFIVTQSGNRYMFRHSQSRGGELVMYNERKGGFESENAHPFMIPDIQKDVIATKGSPFIYFDFTDEEQGTGEWVQSSTVTKIELRKGHEAGVRTFDQASKETKDYLHNRFHSTH
jgi:hypothetical protein